MDIDEGRDPQPGLHPVVGVVIVLGLVTLVLGAGLVLRQAGTRPLAAMPAQTSGTKDAAIAPGLTTRPAPTSTVLLAVAVPAATGTPTIEASRSVRTPVVQQLEPTRATESKSELELQRTPQPLVIGALQTPPRPTETSATAARTGEASVPEPPATPTGGDQSSSPGETYTGLPVAVPATAILAGAELPVGPAGVQSDGARAFARTLLVRAHAQDAGLVEDPSLRQVAEQALVDELTVSMPTGRVVPTRRRQGSVTVQIDVVATLPETSGASLRVFSSARVPAIGVAVGVAGRVEPDYLPDLVAIAAIAYR